MPERRSDESVTGDETRVRPEDTASYRDWVAEFDPWTASDQLSEPRRRPRISVLLLHDAEPERTLAGPLLDSLSSQSYPEWELILSERIGAVTDDERVRALGETGEGGWSEQGLEAVQGEFVLTTPIDARFHPDAFLRIAMEIDRDTSPDLIYADEDVRDPAGARLAPVLKPGWDPELLLGRNYIGSVAAFRARRVREVVHAGSRPVSAEAPAYDLLLRMATVTDPTDVVHIPSILHWTPIATRRRDDPSPAVVRSLVRDALRRRDVGAEIVPAEQRSEWNRILWPIPDPPPRASIILPTRDNANVLERSASGVLESTDYPDIELLIIDNGSTQPDALRVMEELAKDSRVRVVRRDIPFNFSKLNNAGAQVARGTILVLLNDDTEVIDPHWLRELVSQALRPEIGVVGARLLYPDGSVQHAGIVMEHGAPWHQYKLSDPGFVGPVGELALTRSVSSVTAACLAMRKDVFDEVGGMEERLAVAFNDVDLCLRVAKRGYRIICTPFAELYHHESASRGLEDTPEKKERLSRELTWLREHWTEEERSEPYANPRLRFGWNDTGDWGLPLTSPSPRAERQPDLTLRERVTHVPTRLGWLVRRAIPTRIRNPLFDDAWYLERNPEVSRYRWGPYRHFRQHGAREGRDPNRLFDIRWYLTRNPDVAAGGANPLDHYLRHGASEGRDPSPRFSTRWYESAYPDVRASGQNPLFHFLRHGEREGRKPLP